jgi:hypothetical protein
MLARNHERRESVIGIALLYPAPTAPQGANCRDETGCMQQCSIFESADLVHMYDMDAVIENAHARWMT